MGQQNVGHPIVLALRRSNVLRDLDGWLAFPHRDGCILLSFDWLVSCWSILCEGFDMLIASLFDSEKPGSTLTASVSIYADS